MTTNRERMHMGYCPSLGACIGIGGTASPVCEDFDSLLCRIEDDRAHAEAQKLYDMHDEVLLAHGPDVAGGFAKAAIAIDPYTRDKDGQYYRKSDGKPVAI